MGGGTGATSWTGASPAVRKSRTRDLARRWLGRHRHDCDRLACRDEAAEQLRLWEMVVATTENSAAFESDDPSHPQWRVEEHRDLTTWDTVSATDAGTTRAKTLHRADYATATCAGTGCPSPAPTKSPIPTSANTPHSPTDRKSVV